MLDLEGEANAEIHVARIEKRQESLVGHVDVRLLVEDLLDDIRIGALPGPLSIDDVLLRIPFVVDNLFARRYLPGFELAARHDALHRLEFDVVIAVRADLVLARDVVVVLGLRKMERAQIGRLVVGVDEAGERKALGVEGIEDVHEELCVAAGDREVLREAQVQIPEVDELNVVTHARNTATSRPRELGTLAPRPENAESPGAEWLEVAQGRSEINRRQQVQVEPCIRASDWLGQRGAARGIVVDELALLGWILVILAKPEIAERILHIREVDEAAHPASPIPTKRDLKPSHVLETVRLVGAVLHLAISTREGHESRLVRYVLVVTRHADEELIQQGMLVAQLVGAGFWQRIVWIGDLRHLARCRPRSEQE